MLVDEVATAVRSGPIAVLPYDRRWPAAFEQVRVAIERTLGVIPSEIHHIGSTAVSGLCAKPKIDIDVVLHSADDVAAAVGLLKMTDRDYHGDPYQDGMWTFTSRRMSFPGHRLYVCAPGTPTHLDRVLFRDYLRSHPDVAAAYGALKRNLVIKSRGDWNAYTKGKSSFVTKVVEKARSSRSQRGL